MCWCVRAELSDMRRKADSQKREAEEAAATMARIEASAERQYREDMQAAAELKRQTLGEWVRSFVCMCACACTLYRLTHLGDRGKGGRAHIRRLHGPQVGGHMAR